MSLKKLLFKEHVEKILILLNKNGKMYVTEITDSLGLNRGSLSRLLKELYEHNLVDKERELTDDIIPKTYYFLTEKGKLLIEVYKMVDKVEKSPIHIENNHGTVINKVDSLTITNNFENGKKK
ncbi:winged helix-turn-helix domain-containing protein [Methanococcus maripaludis]|uniref:Winged helix-turn-helix transcriptional regulator n=1 Tax=Methanococcus maripaludis TaxID=39152 RepID=A0A8T3W917_METMI|nr:winged helix-turn-helix domain-containing protein [Methanococcus maripaludis]MBG0769673.1 winged helix-turn-helix transcriptional regulator [Methanococcus maripaludis]